MIHWAIKSANDLTLVYYNFGRFTLFFSQELDSKLNPNEAFAFLLAALSNVDSKVETALLLFNGRHTGAYRFGIQILSFGAALVCA